LEPETAERLTLKVLSKHGFLSRNYPFGEVKRPFSRSRSSADISLRDLAAPAKESTTDRPAGFDESLFDTLRELRREYATARGVPAYVIFHDAVLIQMATRRPTSLAALGAIPGVGDRKQAELGPAFLARIQQEVAERGLSTDVAERPAKVTTLATGTRDRLVPHFVAGSSVMAVAEVVGLAPTTVSDYLAEWIFTAAPPSIRPWVPDEDLARIEAVVREFGHERLKPIFEALDGSIDYATLRLAVAHLRQRGI
jgi:ATP-dependent DNA helicase RecQ